MNNIPRLATKQATRKGWEDAGCLSDYYNQLKEGRKSDCMVLVDEEIYTNQLEVLPPMYHNPTGANTAITDVFSLYMGTTCKLQQAFQVGESQATVRGHSVYATYAKYNDNFYFCGYMIKQSSK